MSLPYALPTTEPKNDARALRILAKTIYRELRSSGLAEGEVMGIASELLSLVATDMKLRRDGVDAAR